MVCIDYMHAVCVRCLLLCSGVWFPKGIPVHELRGVDMHELLSVTASIQSDMLPLAMQSCSADDM